MEEKRRFSRVTVPFDVTLTDGAGASIPAQLQDVAVQGVFVRCAPSLPLGSVVEVDIVLHGGLEDVHIVAEAEVVHQEPGGLGVRFTALDPESVGHLRNLIAYNADDADRVIEEIYHGGMDE